MKLHVVYDWQGNIIAAGYQDLSAPQAAGLPTPRFGSVAMSNQKVAECDVPAEYVQFDLKDIIERLQVDVRSSQPRLISKR